MQSRASGVKSPKSPSQGFRCSNALSLPSIANGTELCMWVIRQRPLSRRKHAVARVRRFRKDRRPLHHQAVLARP